MKIRADKKSLSKLGILSIASIAAGYINGILGAGGGILFIFILSLLCPDEGESSRTRDSFALTIAAIMPISAVSAVMYTTKGNLTFGEIPIYVVPAIAGGIAGAFLLNKIKISLLKKIFAALIIYSGITMILK